MNSPNRCPGLACLAFALVTLAWVAPSAALPSAGSMPREIGAPATQTEALLAQLRRASSLLQTGEYVAADALLRQVLADPTFVDLPDPLQLAGYVLSAGAAIELEDTERTWEMFDRAIANPAVDADVASAVLGTALEQGRAEKAIAPIRLLAAQAPARLLELDTVTVSRLYGEVLRLKLPTADMLGLLQSLFDANWMLEDGRQPSALWRDLAEIRLREGNEAAAITVANRITGVDDLLAMQVDRRFDGVVAALDPARFDLAAALARDEQTIRATIAANPRNLQNVVELTYVLLDGGRYQDVIDTSDAALARVAASGDQPAFEDTAEALPWIHDNRARGLLGVGRIEEAVSVWEAARRLEEDGGANVSQALNLASLYAALGRTEEAIASLEGVELASPYGWMEYHSTRVYALLATPDDPRARESLAYLREHREDSRSTHVEAMIRIGALDEASDSFREWIADPEHRAAALSTVQGYQVRAFSPIGEQWRTQGREFAARPEIVTAIESVGRVKDVPMYRLQF